MFEYPDEVITRQGGNHQKKWIEEKVVVKNSGDNKNEGHEAKISGHAYKCRDGEVEILVLNHLLNEEQKPKANDCWLQKIFFFFFFYHLHFKRKALRHLDWQWKRAENHWWSKKGGEAPKPIASNGPRKAKRFQSRHIVQFPLLGSSKYKDCMWCDVATYYHGCGPYLIGASLLIWLMITPPPLDNIDMTLCPWQKLPVKTTKELP